MKSANHHTSPAHHRRLPPEVLIALAQENDSERDRLAETWDLASHYLGEEPDDATFRKLGTEIWQQLEQRIQEEEPALRPASPLRLVKTPLRLVAHPAMRRVAVAACITLLVTVGLFYTQRPITVTASYGEQIAHVLPDGSQLTLNSGTRIRYDRDFGDGVRQVGLIEGEAFFDVTKDAKPFMVQTFNGTVTVLGTQFNVRARSHDLEPLTEVAVASGTVQLSANHGQDNAVILKAGQSARLAGQLTIPSTPSTTHTQHALSWRSGGFMFEDHRLGTVLAEIERRFDVRIKVLSKSLLNESVGLLLENPRNAEEILSDLCELNITCRYRAVPGGYEIVQPDTE